MNLRLEPLQDGPAFPDKPRGVAGRNSDNTFIRKVLNWEPDTALDVGLASTYQWIEKQYHDRKGGKRVIE